MQFPTKFVRANTANITSKNITEETKYGFNDQSAKRGNKHKFAVEFKIANLSEVDYRELDAFVDSLDGKFKAFTLASPVRFLGNNSTFSVRVTAPVNSNEIEVDGLTPNQQQALVTGDYIKFAGHDKCYKVMSTEASNASGQATLKIKPPLFSSVATDEVISEAVFTLRMKSDNTSMELDASNMLNDYVVRAEEHTN